MSCIFENHYKLLARSENKIQEVMLQCQSLFQLLVKQILLYRHSRMSSLYAYFSFHKNVVITAIQTATVCITVFVKMWSLRRFKLPLCAFFFVAEKCILWWLKLPFYSNISCLFIQRVLCQFTWWFFLNHCFKLCGMRNYDSFKNSILVYSGG